jgi:N-terminal domain of toast_rack, DUF2154
MLNRLCPFVTISAALALSSCTGVNSSPSGPDQHESRSVELDKSERVRAELKMGSGELDVRGGAQKLLDADFTYNVEPWKPDLRYTSTGAAGDLIVEQPGPTSSTGHAKNHWDLRFNDNVPLDLKVEFGAGEARLNLGSLSLSALNIEIGAGTMRLELRGKPAKDYSVRIRGGVGEATIYLPRDVGISARATGGLGEISVAGLRKNGDLYVNDSSETAKVKIRLDIQGGVGSVKLIAE